MKLLSPQELLWAAEKGALVVDVRPEADYDTVSCTAGPASYTLPCQLLYAGYTWPTRV